MRFPGGKKWRILAAMLLAFPCLLVGLLVWAWMWLGLRLSIEHGPGSQTRLSVGVRVSGDQLRSWLPPTEVAAAGSLNAVELPPAQMITDDVSFFPPPSEVPRANTPVLRDFEVQKSAGEPATSETPPQPLRITPSDQASSNAASTR